MQKFGLKLGLSIAEIVTCCNPLFGIPALIMVIVANSKFKAGDEAGSEKLSKAVNIVLIIGAVLGLLFWIFNVGTIAALFAGMGSLGSSYSY